MPYSHTKVVKKSAPCIEVTGDLLEKAWKRYVALFGVEPRGTPKQLAVLLELIPKELTKQS